MGLSVPLVLDRSEAPIVKGTEMKVPRLSQQRFLLKRDMLNSSEVK